MERLLLFVAATAIDRGGVWHEVRACGAHHGRWYSLPALLGRMKDGRGSGSLAKLHWTLCIGLWRWVGSCCVVRARDAVDQKLKS